MKWKLLSLESERLVRLACVLGLVALPMMVWSVITPTVWPVLVALSVGQAIGTLSFVLYLVVVIRELGIAARLRGKHARPDAGEQGKG
jgi:hypothetical protein